jgi:hypothetical protein
VTPIPPEPATVHVLVAPDKFKGSLSAADAAEATALLGSPTRALLLSFTDNHRAHGWDDRIPYRA